MTDGSPRITALRELSADAELERKDFLWDATEQLRRFLEAQRDRLREIGPIKLADDEQDYLIYHPIDGTWTTRLTYQDPADGEWYDEEQAVDSISEVVELYNPADIYGWFLEAARDPVAHLVPADQLAAEEELIDAGAAPADEEDWEGRLPEQQRATLAAQRLWQLADTYRQQMQAQEKQTLWEFASNAEEVLSRTGDLELLEEDDVLILRTDGRFETNLDLSDGAGALDVEPHRAGLTVVDARTVADFYDPADVLEWVTEALSRRHPTLDFSAVYE
jgi:hypothetical protein